MTSKGYYGNPYTDNVVNFDCQMLSLIFVPAGLGLKFVVIFE